jgi:hypothetical protein
MSHLKRCEDYNVLAPAAFANAAVQELVATTMESFFGGSVHDRTLSRSRINIVNNFIFFLLE